jgi:tetratricopeptide (TPR) repeat protein
MMLANPANPASRRRPTMASAALSAVALIVALAVAGCGKSAPAAPATPASLAGVALTPVTHPDLAGTDPAAAEQIGTARAQLAEALAAGEALPAAESFGAVGRLYHAYGMNTAAASCYDNAERLAPERFRWPYLAGVLASERGDFEAAAAAFERALALADGGDGSADSEPGGGAARIRSGEALLRLGRNDAAAERFRSALDLAGYGPAAHFGLGRALAAAGEPAAAVQELEAVRTALPEAGAVRYPLALAYRALGDLAAAARVLDGPSAGAVGFPDPESEALLATAEGAAFHLRRGGEAMAAGRLEEAVTAYRQAVEAAPESAEARRNLALALTRAGDPQAAVAELETALAQHPEDLLVRFDLGNALSAAGKTSEAIAELSGAVEQQPDFVPARFNLANDLIRAGRWGEARQQLEAVVELDPRHTNARYLLAMSLQQGGQSGEAERRLRELLEQEPDHLPSRQGLAAILVSRGDAAGAMQLYRDALARGAAGRAAAQIQLAIAELEGRRNRPQARDLALRAAIAAAPDFAPARMVLAGELAADQRWAEAAEQFEAAIAAEADPTNPTAANPTAYLGAAQAWAATGRWADARRVLEAGLRRLPTHLVLEHSLARLLAAAPDASVRDGQRALQLAEQAYRTEATVPHAETVAMAMAETGDFERADEWISSLLKRVEESGGDTYAEIAKRLRQDRSRYRHGQPVRRQQLW